MLAYIHTTQVGIYQITNLLVGNKNYMDLK